MSSWPLVPVMVVAALACLGAATACRDRFRRSLVRQMLSAALVHSAVWCLAGAALAWGVDDSDLAQGLRWVATISAGGAAGAMWCLARVVTDPTWRVRRLALAGAWTAAAALMTLASDLGSLLPADAGESGGGSVGWYLRSAAAISWDRLLVAAVMIAAVERLFGVRRHVPPFARSALRAISFALILAAATAAATVATPEALGGVDYAPLGCAIAGLMSADVLMRRHFLRIAPPSAEQVVESMTDAVVVLGPDGRILSMNGAARHLAVGPVVTLPVELLVGWLASEVLHPALAGAAASPRGFTARFTSTSGVHFDARTHVLADPSGDVLGVVLVAREVGALAAQHARAEMAYAGLEHERARVESVVARLLTELSETEQERTQLAEEAVRDALTGVHNRRRLEPAIDAAIAQSRASGRPFAVLIVDVDHFKRVNDTYGHPVGDRVLQALARELMIETRRGESVVRYGGEEFVVVIPDARPFDAVRRADHIRNAVAALRVPLRADEKPGDLSITVSVGVSTYPAQGDEARDLIAKADGALFAAKASGRNCVVMA